MESNTQGDEQMIQMNRSGSRKWTMGTGVAVACLVAMFAGWDSAQAIINLRFTPSELVRSSSQVIVVELQVPGSNAVEGRVTAVLQGNAPAEKTMKFGFSSAKELSRDEVAAAFGTNQTADAIVLISSSPPDAGDEAPAGAIQINTLWYALYRKGAEWTIDKDNQALFSVWGGSSRMMAEVARYVIADPGARFPVQSDIIWERDLDLGKLPGPARSCMVVDFGGSVGICAVFLCDGGDRIFQAGAKGNMPVDITQKMKLTTASRLAVPGDFDRDGRIDLVCWDGKGLKLASQSADGVFAVRALAVKVPECVSLDMLEASAGGAGLIAGTTRGPILLAPDGKGDFATKSIGGELPRDLGAAGCCAVADFNGDGKNDVMQFFESGTVLFAGEGPGQFGAGVKAFIPLVKNPGLAVCGDFDSDGKLDVIVGGEDGMALLSHGETRRMDNNTYATGELAYHGNANRPRVTGVSLCDVNNDGRQGAALFYPDRNPLVFFNRGFGCFGMARELAMAGPEAAGGMPMETAGEAPKPPMKGTQALQTGQTTGLMFDINGDCVQDLVSVDLQGNGWVLLGGAQGRRVLGLTLVASKAIGPTTVSVSDAKRRTGMHVVKPGIPVFIGCAQAGVVKLDWTGPDGKPRTQKAVVVNPSRAELAL